VLEEPQDPVADPASPSVTISLLSFFSLQFNRVIKSLALKAE
jgi:hypothetical protein